MKLRSLYNDVVSKVSQLDVNTSKLLHVDYMEAINDSIAELIEIYANLGLYDGITKTETIYFNIKDLDYSLLYYTDLANKINKNIKPKTSIVNCLVKPITTIGLAGDASYTAGTKVIYDNYVLECLETYTDSDYLENDPDFDGTNIREYTPGNMSTYYFRDVLSYNGSYYRCVTSSFVATDASHDITTDPLFSKIYWIRKQPIYFTSKFISFNDLSDMVLYTKMTNVYVFTVFSDKLYMNKNPQSIVLTYVPEWVDLTSLDEEINFSRKMISDIKIKTIEKLAVKLNVGK